MPVTFGSGATVDAAGAVVAPSAVDVVSTPPSEPPVPAESSVVPAPDAGQAVLPGEGSPEIPPEPTPPADAPPVEPTEGDDGEDELVLPPTTRSQRQFVRRLLRENAQYTQQVPQLQQQVATLTSLLHELRQAPSGPAPAPVEPAPPLVPAGPAVPPRPETFATHEEYVSALTAHSASEAVRQALAERDQREQAQRQAWEAQLRQQRDQQREQAWLTKLAEGRQQFQDFDVALGNPAVSLAPLIQPLVVESVLESTHGPAMLHYLGTHPDVTQALNQMSPYGAARLLGEIEAVVRPRPVETPAPPAPAPRPPPPAPVVPPTPLPAPLQPVGGSQAPTSPMQFRPGMPLGDYTRMREAEEARRRSA